MPATQTISLYEDWRARRDQLLRAAPQTILSAAAAHLKVLEFLLNRYRDAEIARAVAMFPLPRGIELNQRAIIINHHLGSRYVAGVKTADEANTRVASILQRMATPVAVDDDDSPWPGNSTLRTTAMRRAEFRFGFHYTALASPDYKVRSWAINSLSYSGSLQDTSLLSDLAEVTDENDRFKQERRQLLWAMRVIGRRCHSK